METIGSAQRRRTPAAHSPHRVARVLAEPAHLEAELQVEVLDQRGVPRRLRGWKPSDGEYPAKGDTAIVGEANDGRLFVVTWWTDRELEGA